jgi:alpha-L-rhamnosidase
VNVLSANAFARISLVAAVVGDHKGTVVQQKRSASVAGAINRLLVRSDGLYVDGLRADGTQSTDASQLVNAQALAYGLVPASRRRAVGKYVASLGIDVEPDYGMEVLRALHAAGLDSDVVETLTNASRPGWAWILDHGGTFCWEAWVLSDLIGDSMSHGWGSSALVAMQETLLGVVPVAPTREGPMAVLQIEPAFAVLDHASGAIPTVAGTAAIGWSQTAATIHLALSLPPNSRANLRLPAKGASSVTMGSVPVQHIDGVSVESSGNGVVTLGVGAGSYEFDVSRS